MDPSWVDLPPVAEEKDPWCLWAKGDKEEVGVTHPLPPPTTPSLRPSFFCIVPLVKERLGRGEPFLLRGEVGVVRRVFSVFFFPVPLSSSLRLLVPLKVAAPRAAAVGVVVGLTDLLPLPMLILPFTAVFPLLLLLPRFVPGAVGRVMAVGDDVAPCSSICIPSLCTRAVRRSSLARGVRETLFASLSLSPPPFVSFIATSLDTTVSVTTLPTTVVGNGCTSFSPAGVWGKASTPASDGVASGNEDSTVGKREDTRDGEEQKPLACTPLSPSTSPTTSASSSPSFLSLPSSEVERGDVGG